MDFSRDIRYLLQTIRPKLDYVRRVSIYQSVADKLWWTGGNLSPVGFFMRNLNVPCHFSSLPPLSLPHNTAYPTSTTIDCLLRGVYCMRITSHPRFVKSDKTSPTQSIPCFSSKAIVGTFCMTIQSSCRFLVLQCNDLLFPVVSSYVRVFFVVISQPIA